MFFIWPQKFFSRYSTFCPKFCFAAEKWLDEEAKVNSRINEVMAITTNGRNILGKAIGQLTILDNHLK